MTTRVFVYGTLKRGCSNFGWIRQQQFVGEAETLPIYRMFDAGGFPALVADERDGVAIQGELWDVDAAGLARLDVLEGVAEGEYERVAARLPSQHGEAEIYLWLGSTLGMPEIGSCWKE
ncbi:MAG: gamma-glutamylcyclotransferase [Verrucomicrobiaceae bacterium]|nr:gamma-glutamylcyclotransferase [Verrucomicrobiaceae bacterium]